MSQSTEMSVQEQSVHGDAFDLLCDIGENARLFEAIASLAADVRHDSVAYVLGLFERIDDVLIDNGDRPKEKYGFGSISYDKIGRQLKREKDANSPTETRKAVKALAKSRKGGMVA